LTLIHMDNPRVHTAGNPREIGCFPIQTHAAAPYIPYIVLSDFSF
jgi:hypothetical protein